MKKDIRKVYNYQKIEVNGNVIFFDGKYNPETNILKIYRLYGNASEFAEAVQNFCIDNKIDIAIVPV